MKKIRKLANVQLRTLYYNTVCTETYKVKYLYVHLEVIILSLTDTESELLF